MIKQPYLSSGGGDAQPDPRGLPRADEALVVRQPHVDGQGRGLHHHRQGEGAQPDQGRPHPRLPIRKSPFSLPNLHGLVDKYELSIL